MPQRGRIVAVVGLVAVAAVIGVWLLASGGKGYEVHMIAQDAGQLVKGNEVQVGGVKVGTVSAIDLTQNNLADVTLKINDSRFDPLHAGTRATIRSTSLSAVAGRIVTLEPGPNNGDEIGSGGSISYESSQSIVDLDAVLNTLDAQTRSSLQAVVHDSAALYASDTSAANRGLAALNPALSQTKSLADELLKDRRTFEQFIVQGAGVVNAVAERNSDVESGLIGAARTANAVASQTSAVDATLRQAPATLRRANTTLANLRAALADVRPALRDVRPAAPKLRQVLARTAPLTRKAKPVVSQTTQLLPTVSRVLRGLPALDAQARPAFGATVDAIEGTLPILDSARTYVPDIIAGVLNGFGGTQAGYYDANGHYVRIAPELGPTSLTGLLGALGIPLANNAQSGLKTKLVARCPGSATQPAPDKSNPYRTDATSFCKPEQVP